MRIIRTEFYFREEDLGGRESGREGKSPAVAAAWIALANNPSLNPDDLLTKIRDVTNDWISISDFLNASVTDFSDRLAISRVHRSHDSKEPINFAGFILEQEIVIERSPPTAMPLSALIAKSPSIAIGTYIGIEAASSPLLMFVTVPGGILLVSSAIGISKALEGGLYKFVGKMFK